MTSRAENSAQGTADTTRFLADVETLLAYHIPNDDGTCTGCYLQFGLLHWYPCEQAMWAMSARGGNGDLYRF